jgi:hypothetical protein
MKKSICIIGAGTYGSYLAYCLSEKHPDATIHLFDVGGSRIRSESEMGFLSDVKGSYKATSEEGISGWEVLRLNGVVSFCFFLKRIFQLINPCKKWWIATGSTTKKC